MGEVLSALALPGELSIWETQRGGHRNSDRGVGGRRERGKRSRPHRDPEGGPQGGDPSLS